jgi:hypothetical protein
MDATKAAQFLGRLGGSMKSKAKTKASRANGELGGRPRKYPACRRYPNKSHRFDPKTNKCHACGYQKPA